MLAWPNWSGDLAEVEHDNQRLRRQPTAESGSPSPHGAVGTVEETATRRRVWIRISPGRRTTAWKAKANGGNAGSVIGRKVAGTTAHRSEIQRRPSLRQRLSRGRPPRRLYPGAQRAVWRWKTAEACSSAIGSSLVPMPRSRASRRHLLAVNMASRSWSCWRFWCTSSASRLDKVCRVLAFFCQLPLSRSQADALLRQLAQHWEGGFYLLCGLIALRGRGRHG